LKQCLRQVYSENLMLLTAGSVPGSLLNDSASGTLEALLKECHGEFEFVVIDTSPLLPVVDGRIIGQYTDGAILAVQKDSSQIPQIVSARNIMSEHGITVLGCVVSGQGVDSYYDSYGYSAEVGPVTRGITASRSTSVL
jgi:Mrp family chromosome partitioning ATPase